jgi:hypothetical protein
MKRIAQIHYCRKFKWLAGLTGAKRSAIGLSGILPRIEKSGENRK